MAKIRDGSGLVDHNIFRQVVGFVHDRVRVGSTPRHIANTIWRCARLAHKSTPLIEDAGRVVIARLGELKPQELASTVWGQVRCVFHNCCHDLFF
ncbi:pikD [Symbiodinium necroappetens]|uniref:PikD protein n=1 Tax=Symbiodinium necroappetens TaxID=1628268 RepID=A0A812LL85_9DINO|nr:pikD [Symbiodinium necroappetens]